MWFPPSKLACWIEELKIEFRLVRDKVTWITKCNSKRRHQSKIQKLHWYTDFVVQKKVPPNPSQVFFLILQKGNVFRCGFLHTTTRHTSQLPLAIAMVHWVPRLDWQTCCGVSLTWHTQLVMDISKNTRGLCTYTYIIDNYVHIEIKEKCDNNDQYFLLYLVVKNMFSSISVQT